MTYPYLRNSYRAASRHKKQTCESLYSASLCQWTMTWPPLEHVCNYYEKTERGVCCDQNDDVDITEKKKSNSWACWHVKQREVWFYLVLTRRHRSLVLDLTQEDRGIILSRETKDFKWLHKENLNHYVGIRKKVLVNCRFMSNKWNSKYQLTLQCDPNC